MKQFFLREDVSVSRPFKNYIRMFIFSEVDDWIAFDARLAVDLVYCMAYQADLAFDYEHLEYLWLLFLWTQLEGSPKKLQHAPFPAWIKQIPAHKVDATLQPPNLIHSSFILSQLMGFRRPEFGAFQSLSENEGEPSSK